MLLLFLRPSRRGQAETSELSLEQALQIFTDLFIVDYKQAGKSSSPKKSLLPLLVPTIKPVHTFHLAFVV